MEENTSKLGVDEIVEEAPAEEVVEVVEETTEAKVEILEDTEVPLDKNVRLMSPTMMVVRRFFRSKLSIIGLIMVIKNTARKLTVREILPPYISLTKMS